MICLQLIKHLEELAPVYLAESWDNPGLLVGRRDREIKRVLVALDVTESVIDEAVDKKCDIIVTHHPLIFGSVKSITDTSFTGNKILRLAENRINHYAMHTNLDIAFGGTNDTLSKIIGLDNIEPLAVSCEQNGMVNGLGRMGELTEEMSFGDFASQIKDKLSLDSIRIIGDTETKVKIVGLCTGAGFEFINEAKVKGCDVYVTADVKFHDAQKAIDMGMCVVDATHYATENLIVPEIKKYIDKISDENNYQLEVFESKVNGQVFKHI